MVAPPVRATVAGGIEHRLTKPNQPWSLEDQKTIRRIVFPLNVKRFHFDSHDQLRTHLADFMAAYNFARRLKTLAADADPAIWQAAYNFVCRLKTFGGLIPYEYICKIWTPEPDSFIPNPVQQMPGLNS